MTPRRKRRLTYITIAVFFLLGGVEYGKLIYYCTIVHREYPKIGTLSALKFCTHLYGNLNKRDSNPG